MPISLLNSQKRRIKVGPLLRAVRRILRSEGAAGAEVSILLTDDATIHRLNRDYRWQDKPTDVLSFSQRESDGTGFIPPSPGGKEILGDVVISVDSAERQASAYGLDGEHELAMLAGHGALHP